MDVDVATRERVRDAFLAEGFARVGFARAEAVEDGATPWVRAGRHAGMDWMAREPAARADPARLLPGVRTVVCAGAAYPATDARGPIAGYARGEDYHRTLRDALHRAGEALVRLVPGARVRACVDVEPLLERAFAARAGLGWIGRNTMLLDERHGPWMLLGELLTDATFPPDAAAPDRCGTCTACVDACPTGALVDGRALDARRCLSYWTIEHRGPLPEAWADALDGRVFGCDDCLTACPFPSRATRPSLGPEDAATGTPPFVPRADLQAPDLDALEARARDSFRRHFGSTPIERARRGGLLRNLGAVRRGRDARGGAR